jgi:hypothetical protein
MRVERPRLDCRAVILAETNSLTVTAPYTILWIQAFANTKPKSDASPRHKGFACDKKSWSADAVIAGSQPAACHIIPALGFFRNAPLLRVASFVMTPAPI